MLLYVATQLTNYMNQTEQLDLLSLIIKGGVVMIPIFILSIISIYIIIERFQFIKRRGKQNATLVNQIADQLQSGNLKAAVTLCEREQSACAEIIGAGLSAIGKPINEIESMMETASQIEIAEFEKRLGYLGLIAGIAPMLGFIGTISGVIKIFYNISLSDNISIGIIAGGLYEKMITSGSGLIVGVVAYSGYHLLSILIDRAILNIQKQSFQFVKTIQQPAYENQKK